MKALTFDQIAEGRRAALANAKELIQEAALLHDHGHWARVVFLCQIAGEELGKIFLFTAIHMQMVTEPDSVKWNKVWKQLTSHKAKLKLMNHMEDLLVSHREIPEDYLTVLDGEVSVLDIGKQKALYSDMTEGSFYVPSQLFNEEIATNALKWARGRLEFLTSYESMIEISLKSATKELIEKAAEKIGATKLLERLRRKR
jgi:AbiV family abortive infection protein